MHIEELMNEIERFRARRGWNAHHQPAHLAMSICIEAAELLENYQWGAARAPDAQNVQDELADVLIYALTLAAELRLDVAAIVRAKMAQNALKYPAPPLPPGLPASPEPPAC